MLGLTTTKPLVNNPRIHQTTYLKILGNIFWGQPDLMIVSLIKFGLNLGLDLDLNPVHQLIESKLGSDKTQIMFSSLVQSLKWLGFRKSSDFAPIQVPLTNEETMRLPLTNGLIVLKDES